MSFKDPPLKHIKSEWEIIEQLGIGSFGSVYKAKKFNGLIENNKVDICAIKIIEKKCFNQEEIDTLNKVKSVKGFLEYYGYGCDDDNNYYIYMQYIEGAISIRDRYIRKSIGGSATLNDHNIAHRDVKTDHILLIYDNENNNLRDIKLIDFGSSKILKINYTKYNTNVGTFNYMAPEVKLQNGRASRKSDIYSFGCVLLEMVGDLSITDDQAIPNIPNTIDVELKHLIRQCLVFNPNGRLSSGELLKQVSRDGIVHNYSVFNIKTYDNISTEADTYLDLSFLKVPLSAGLVTFLNLSSYNHPLSAGVLPNSIIYLNLSSYNHPLSAGIIPNGVTQLSFKKFNQYIEIDDIPPSVLFLDLGEEFEFPLNGDDLPQESITTLKCSFNFSKNPQKLLNRIYYPASIINLSLPNYNLPLKANSIYKSISILELGSNFKHLETLAYIPSSVYQLEFGDPEFNEENFKFYLYLIKPYIHTLITKLIINGKDVTKHFYEESGDSLISIADKLKLLPELRFKEDDIILLVIEIVKLVTNNAHREIKGENILLLYNDQDERIGIMFGISKQTDKDGYFTIGNTGTHMAPEVKLKKIRPNYKSNVYCIGCTIIEMAGGDLKQRDKNGDPIIPDHLSPSLNNIIRRCILYNANGRLDLESLSNILSNDSPIISFDLLNIVKSKNVQYDDPLLNEPLTIGLLKQGIKGLSLPTFNHEIEIGSIPSTVAHLSLKVFNRYLEIDAIPSSVTYLDLGEFDIQQNGENLPDSILTLRCGYQFTKVFNRRSIPTSVTNLQLYNYNLSLTKLSIPSSVAYLTLGSNFNDFESLSNLPLSIINLQFGTSSPQLDDIRKYISTSSITLLVVNGEQIDNLLVHDKNEWEVGSKLGEGGFGKVFKANKLRGYLKGTERSQCVIKVIKEEKFNRNEIDILKLLKYNPYSVDYYGCGTLESDYYIYTECFDNAISIHDKLKSHSFKEDEIRMLGIEIVKAIHSIHEYTVIHCDIKGGNILLVYNHNETISTIKLIDYGISVYCSNIQRNNDRYGGTNPYKAPEVRLNGDVSYKSDIYSFGCTLIEMAGGDSEIKDGVIKIPGHLSNDLKEIILRSMLPSPNARLDYNSLLHLLSFGQIKSKESFAYELESPFNKPLKIGSLNLDGIKSLSLPTFNHEIEIGSIPSTVAHLSLKVFNQYLKIDAIPSSVTYLDLGEFDIQQNGENLPDSILTLRCGYQYANIINGRTIPASVTNLQLYNYNKSLKKNSIPNSVSLLTLGSNFNLIESLSNLPDSVFNLKFGNEEFRSNKSNYLPSIKQYINPSILKITIDGDDVSEEICYKGPVSWTQIKNS